MPLTKEVRDSVSSCVATHRLSLTTHSCREHHRKPFWRTLSAPVFHQTLPDQLARFNMCWTVRHCSISIYFYYAIKHTSIDQKLSRNLLLQFRWNHRCAYNDTNYHIVSRGLFHGDHVGFTPSWTQRTDNIRLPSYQKTYYYVDIKFAFLRYFFRESVIICGE